MGPLARVPLIPQLPRDSNIPVHWHAPLPRASLELSEYPVMNAYLKSHVGSTPSSSTHHRTSRTQTYLLYYSTSTTTSIALRSSGSASSKSGVIPAVFDLLMWLRSWMAFIGRSIAIRRAQSKIFTPGCVIPCIGGGPPKAQGHK
jgi:hypothetical protein